MSDILFQDMRRLALHYSATNTDLPVMEIFTRADLPNLPAGVRVVVGVRMEHNEPLPPAPDDDIEGAAV